MITTSRRERRWALVWAIVLVGLASLPYLVAWQIAPADTQYTGLLINHFDGESYYAKMQQGARGDWLFRLPFTPEVVEGSYIFTFYLALGHLAAALGFPIPLMYHLARMGAGLFLLLVAYHFIARFFDHVPTRRAASMLLGFSAGLGWLLAPLGLTTADLWVAEGFTFLSILANPHFPLAIGLMLLIFLPVLNRQDKSFRISRLPGAALCGLLLSVIQPFAVPIVLVVLAVYLALLGWQSRHIPWPEILTGGTAAVVAMPVMLYDLYVYQTNAALAAWSAQNLTPSLPPWNYALGYGLVLLLALPGIAVALRRRQRTDLFLLAWVGSVSVLLYVPFALQRRFITGFHVPLTLLAVAGLERVIWLRLRPARRRLATSSIVALTALTSLFVPAVSLSGVARGLPPLVMSSGEAAACAWLHDHTAWTDTVLAPPESGQFIPAWAGNRVVYGHPFETIDAEAKKAEVARFYDPETGYAERRSLLERYNVRYVLVWNTNLKFSPATLGLTSAWNGGNSTLYQVREAP